MDQRHAIAAMALADVTRYDEHAGNQLSADIIDMAAEFLPDPDAPSSAPTPSARTDPGKSGELSDPEAGG